MKISKNQRHGVQIVITGDNVTASQIREARDRWPEWISSERSANALGLPVSHTSGDLPVYPPSEEVWRAREDIARIINAHWGDESNEHSTDLMESNEHSTDLMEGV